MNNSETQQGLSYQKHCEIKLLVLRQWSNSVVKLSPKYKHFVYYIQTVDLNWNKSGSDFYSQ